MISKIGVSIVDQRSCTHGIIGRRKDMEDEEVILKDKKFEICGLFDGHGGKHVATYCKNHLAKNLMAKCMTAQEEISTESMKELITKVFLSIDAEIHAVFKVDAEYTGCAAVVVIWDKTTDMIYFANLGDSRAILFDVSNRILYETEDHKPGDPKEQKRIEKAGGYVSNNIGDVARVNGNLAIPRAFGDTNLKLVNGKYNSIKGPVSAVPKIGWYPRKYQVLTVMLACDGVWDVMTSQHAVDLYMDTSYAENARIDLDTNGCRSVVAHAYDYGSTDNITVMVVDF